jgi:REP element-mobilizing transposase RayT
VFLSNVRNMVDRRRAILVRLITGVVANTAAGQIEHLRERHPMPAYARSQVVPCDEVGVYHCISRCVRRAFLCGVDPITGHDYDHRKEWIRERLEHLASIFAIDICGYTVMSNHLHAVLRCRPDLVRDWSADEIAFSWSRLFPSSDPATGEPIEPSACDINMIVSDPERVAELRQRLSSLSWFMRCLNEQIARRANREDECKGRFWEGRFKSQALLDEAAILACSIYVDLNPIRAGVTQTPEQSTYTSAYDRIQSMVSVSPSAAELDQASLVAQPAEGSIDPISSGAAVCSDSWLCELTLQEGPGEIDGGRSTPSTSVPGFTCAEPAMPTGEPQSRPRRAARASEQGYLPIKFDKYLSLLDWTGRQIRASSRGTIPAHLAPILERLGVIGDCWVETVRQFGRRFKTAVGRPDSLTALAARRGKAWLQGRNAAALAFR